MRTPKTTTQTLNDNTFASDPGLIIPSWEKVRRLQPDLFPSYLWKLTHRDFWQRYERHLTRIEEQLSNGDSRAAVVLSVEPCIVAAYTDELDCVALLRFPDDAARDLGVKRGSRLLTVNTYSWRKAGIASDLMLGPNDLERYGNFYPFIAEFYSDDFERINARKAAISEHEFRLAERLGHEALKRGVAPRDGRTLYCGRPVKQTQ